MRAGCATEPQRAGAGQLECAVDREACPGVCAYCRVFLEQCFLKEGCPGLISSIYFTAFLFTLAYLASLSPLGGFAEYMSRNPRAPRCVLRAGIPRSECEHAQWRRRPEKDGDSRNRRIIIASQQYIKLYDQNILYIYE